MSYVPFAVEHLRRTADCLSGTEHSGLGAAMKMAADEITRLQEENERKDAVIASLRVSLLARGGERQ